MKDALTRAVAVLHENGELHQVDSVLGKYLFALPAWTEGHTRAAMRMVRKYVARLRGYGIRASDLMGAVAEDWEGARQGDAETRRRGEGGESAKMVGMNCTAFTVRFPFDKGILEATRLLPSARWDETGGVWKVPFTLAGAERLFEFAETYGFSVAPEVFEKVDELTGEAAEAAAASREEAAEYEIEGLHRELRPYQQAGVRYLVEVAKGRALLCDEMGLGKTIESLAAVKKLEAWPLLVICPASLKYNWEAEVRAVLGLKSLVVKESALPEESESSMPQNSRARVICTSGSIQMFREKKKGGKRAGGKELEICRPTEFGQGYEAAPVMVINYDLLKGGIFEALKRVKWGAVIVDESHYIKEAKAQRTEAVRKLVRGVPVRLALTGTPVVNQIADLLPQLSVIGQLEALGGFWHFAERYCEAKKKQVSGRGDTARFIWDLSGRANAKELHERLRATCFLRRLKKNVLAELPPKVRATVPIELSNWDEYRKAEADVVQWLAGRAAKEKEFLSSIAHLSESEKAEAVEQRHMAKAEQLASSEALVRFEALKQLSVKGKLAGAKAWIANFLESGQKLGVFAEHVEVVEELAKHFGAPMIYGETPAKKRQEIVERFQKDPACNLVVLNTKAGGVGLTLTAASNCVVLELPWTGAALDQAEDRFHRFGQRRSVTCYYLMGKNTIDWQIYGIIRGKRELTRAVVDGQEDGETRGLGDAERVVRELQRELLAPRFL